MTDGWKIRWDQKRLTQTDKDDLTDRYIDRQSDSLQTGENNLTKVERSVCADDERLSAEIGMET